MVAYALPVPVSIFFLGEDLYAMFGFFFIATLLLFIAGSVVVICSLHSDREATFRAGRVLFFLSLVPFTALGVIRFSPFTVGAFLRATSVLWGYFYLLSLLLAIILLYLNFSRWKGQLKPFMAIALPFMAVLMVISIPFLDSQRRVAVDLELSFLPLHIVLTFLGELFFFFSFVGSVLYLVMEAQLRKKASMKFIYRLPSLEAIENFNRWAIARSFFLLSAGLVMGVAMLFFSFGRGFLGTPKEIIIYFSWIVITLIFCLRHTRRMGLSRTGLINIISFIVIMFLYLFANIFVTTGFHSFR